MVKKIIHKLTSLSALDYIIALMVLCVTGYGLVYFSTKKEYVYLDLTSQAVDFNAKGMVPLGYQEADAIRKGDAVYNSFGQKVAVVTEAKTVDFGGVDKYIWVVIKTKARYNPRTNIYSYNDTQLLIGNSLALSLGRVAFRGRILNIYKNPEDKYKNFQMKNVLATVLFRGVEPSHAEMMRSFEARNSLNEIIAKTISTEVRPEELDVSTDKGIISHGNSTIYKDVTLKILMPNVPCSEDTCFFNNSIDLKIGVKYFWIHSSTTLLSNGFIMNLEYVSNSAPTSTVPQQ